MPTDDNFDDYGLCWSCQVQIDQKTAVWLDNDLAIQCCAACWKKIPIERRLEIAIKFHDRTIEGLGVRETLDMVRDLIANSINGYLGKFLDDGGRMN